MITQNDMKKQGVVWVARLILIIAVGLALFLCFYKLGDVPPALNGDEAIFGFGALELLENGPKLYIEGQGGGGILTSYIVAFFYLLSEPGKMPLRFQASLFGVLTVLLVFFTTRTLFQSEGRDRATLIAALAALLLVLNPTYITISRIAFSSVHLPFFELLVVFSFWAALTRQRLQDFILAGLALALVFYGYIAGAVMPVIIGAFLVLAAVAFWISNRRNRSENDFVTNLFKQTPPSQILRNLGVYAVVFGLGILPLILFYFTHLDAGSTGRMGETSFLNPNINQGNPWGILWYGLRGNYTAFGLRPLTWLVQVDYSRFLTDPIALLYFAGLGIAVFRFNRPHIHFLLWWWVFTILPAALAPTEVPYPSRAFGVFVPLSILGSLPLAELGMFAGGTFTHWREKISGSVARIGSVVALLGLIWLAVIAMQQTYFYYDYYFNEFPFRKDILSGFNSYADDLAQDMARLAEPDSAFILLRDTAAGSTSPNGSVNFFYRLSNSPAPLYWVVDNETMLPAMLTEIAANARTLHVVSWHITRHSGADPKSVVPYYLEKFGYLARSHPFGDYNIDTYILPELGINFSSAENLAPVDFSFGGLVSLIDYAYGNAGPGKLEAHISAAGQPVWVRLRWLKTADYPQNLKVSLILLNKDNIHLASVDKYLQSNFFHQRFGDWGVGSEEDTYFLLSLPDDLIPGTYTLAALVYDDETLAPRPVLPANVPWAELGRISVVPPVQPAPAPSIDDFIRISGTEAAVSFFVPPANLPVNAIPGQVISLPFTWYASERPLVDYSLAIVLQDQSGTKTTLQHQVLIGGGDYPTGRWRSGETLTEWITVRIPAYASGTQTLQADLFNQNDLVAQWPLTTLQVTNWPREYQLPANIEPLGIHFGNSIELAGYMLEIVPASEGSNDLSLTCFWRAIAPIAEDYVVFVHLRDANGQVVTQIDQSPAAGSKPMTGWMLNEVVADSVTLNLPPEIDPETAQVVLGLYSPQTFQRLGLTDPEQTGKDYIEIPLLQKRGE